MSYAWDINVPAATYDHMITVRIEVLPKEIALTAVLLNKLINIFRRVFGVK